MERQPDRTGGQRGVTLIELVVAMTILAILLTAGIPMFRSTLADWKARGAAERMMQDFQWAEEQAARSNQKLEFDIGGNDCGASEWAVIAPGGQNGPQVVRCMAVADFSAQYAGVQFIPSVTGPVGVSPLGLVTPQFVALFSAPAGQAAEKWQLELTSAGRGEIVKG